MRRAWLMVALLVASPASADELNLATVSEARPNLVQARTGLDHGFVAELGYRRVVAWAGRPLLLGGDLTLPVAHPDLGDLRVRATAAAPLLGGGGRGWKLAAALSPTLRTTDNEAARSQALGVDLRLWGGIYGRRGWLAGELGLDWAATTHVTHGDAYRALYPGAKDGWYASTGGTAYAGLNAGLTVGAFDVGLRLGVPRSLSLGPQSIPFYLAMGVSVALPGS